MLFKEGIDTFFTINKIHLWNEGLVFSLDMDTWSNLSPI
jgi:hypothetical protein